MSVKKDAKNAPQQEIKLDPAVAAYMSNGPQAEINTQRDKEMRMTAAQRRKRNKDKERVRALYDLPPEIKQRIDTIADEEGVSKSQLVAFFLYHALQTYDANEIDLTPYKRNSRVPRFEWTLDMPDKK